nr:hypothetical protein [Cupriavidus metallidurans]
MNLRDRIIFSISAIAYIAGAVWLWLSGSGSTTALAIVVFEDKAQGWVNELRNPERWQPGCVALDEQGRSWTTIAGNERDGALMWLPNDPI